MAELGGGGWLRGCKDREYVQIWVAAAALQC